MRDGPLYGSVRSGALSLALVLSLLFGGGAARVDLFQCSHQGGVRAKCCCRGEHGRPARLAEPFAEGSLEASGCCFVRTVDIATPRRAPFDPVGGKRVAPPITAPLRANEGRVALLPVRLARNDDSDLFRPPILLLKRVLLI